MTIPEGYHPEMERMAQLPLGPESHVLIIGDVALEKTTAAFLGEQFGCSVDVVSEHADLDYGGQSFDLVVMNSNLDRPIRIPQPEHINYLMVRRYKPVDEIITDHFGQVIWSEDLWTLQQRAPGEEAQQRSAEPVDSAPAHPEESSSPASPAPEEAPSTPPEEEASSAPSSSGADDRPACPGCGYEVAPEKNYGIAMSAHQRQCEKYQAMQQEEEDAGANTNDDPGL